MNIGIITFHRGNQNYGSVLQAVALQQLLVAMGHEAKVVDYVAPRFLLMSFYYACRAGMQRSFLRRNRAQRDFLRGFNACSGRLTRKGVLSGFAVLVVGSDEVWKINRVRGFNPLYFLHGAKEGTRKVSYAASYVASGAFDRKAGRIGAYLGAIDHLSVREPSTAEMVRRVCGKEAEVVLDPTLVWQGSFRPVPAAGDFLYLYSETFFEAGLCKAAEACAHARGLEVWSFNPQRDMDVHAPTLGVAALVGVFMQARVVVTDTYHGICLAVRCRTPFVYVSQQTKQYKVAALLALLGLEGREVVHPEALEQVMRDAIDWEDVEARLAQARATSLAFLRRALA